MDDLIAFLRARLADDERIARGATAGPWWHNPEKQWLGPREFERYDITKGEEFVGYGGPSPFTGCIAATGKPSDREAMANAAHIARHDPARVLREVAAKRSILDGIQMCQACASGRRCIPHDVSAGLLTTTRPAHPVDEQLVRLLALPYAGHPEFREEWKA